jgi:hypothetical protein
MAFLIGLRFSDWSLPFVSNAAVTSALSKTEDSTHKRPRNRNTSQCFPPSLLLVLTVSRALIAKRNADRKQKLAAIKASHKK